MSGLDLPRDWNGGPSGVTVPVGRLIAANVDYDVFLVKNLLAFGVDIVLRNASHCKLTIQGRPCDVSILIDVGDFLEGTLRCLKVEATPAPECSHLPPPADGAILVDVLTRMLDRSEIDGGLARRVRLGLFDLEQWAIARNLDDTARRLQDNPDAAREPMRDQSASHWISDADREADWIVRAMPLGTPGLLFGFVSGDTLMSPPRREQPALFGRAGAMFACITRENWSPIGRQVLPGTPTSIRVEDGRLHAIQADLDGLRSTPIVSLAGVWMMPMRDEFLAEPKAS